MPRGVARDGLEARPHILTKLGMRRRSEAVAYAMAEGIVRLQDLLQSPALVGD